jgi:hypothetical protein
VRHGNHGSSPVDGPSGDYSPPSPPPEGEYCSVCLEFTVAPPPPPRNYPAVTQLYYGTHDAVCGAGLSNAVNASLEGIILDQNFTTGFLADGAYKDCSPTSTMWCTADPWITKEKIAPIAEALWGGAMTVALSYLCDAVPGAYGILIRASDCFSYADIKPCREKIVPFPNCA